jgi:hypothetical protein
MINWKKRISRDDKYIDMQGMPYYNLHWDETSEIVDIYEYKIPLPAAPPDSHCVNFGLPEHEQIFRRTLIPKQVLSPNMKDGWSQEDIDAFIDSEWNRRRHGVWFFIKGKKTYIPGLLWMKMNHWTSITGNEFIYKFSDWEFFNFFLFALYDPKCDGICDFKCRQIGDTENIILIMWDYGSRVRGTINTIQSCINEGHAKKTYIRLVHGHKKMIYYFRPLNQGTEDPKKGLNLSYPAQHQTHASIREKIKAGEMVNRSSSEDYEYPEINSQFYFGPSKANEFDGATVGRAYLDEFGKSDGKLDPVEWIRVMREASYSKILNKKMGFLLLTSTVEEITPDCLAWALKIWTQADPSARTIDGKTANGLYRIFRNAIDRGDVDRWGFPLKEKTLEEINSTIKILMEKGDIKGVISYRRKNCLTIDDVFKGANDNSQFDVLKLEARYFYVCNEAPKSLTVRGNLKWKDGVKDTVVVWEPNPKGKWLISKHPKDFGVEPNAKVRGIISPKPANTHVFCSATDPIDQKTVLDDDPSKGAITVLARLNEFIDGSPDRYYQFDDPSRGIVIGDPVDGGANFITNRVVCTYLFDRATTSGDPNEYFEDWILTMVYFGTDCLVEKNKSAALFTYLSLRGYELYKMERPTSYKNYRGQEEREGVSATEGNIDAYFSFLTTLSCKWWNTIDHVDLLEQLLSMNYANRGKKDLGVSTGWAYYSASIPRSRYTRPPQEDTTVVHFYEQYV